MKKLIIYSFILCALLLWINLEPQTIVYAESEPIYYRISDSNTILYRTPNLDENNAYFILPPSYFVKYNSDYNDNVMLVSYLDFFGYVDKSNLTRVYSSPVNPYLEAMTFKPQATLNLVVRALPTTQSDFVGTIAYNAENVTYFGSIKGEQTDLTLSDIWYFCRYTSAEQGTITGYVYAPLTKDLTNFSPNEEIVATSPVTPTSAEISLSPELTSSSNLLFIFFLTIPALSILYLIFRSHNKNPRMLKKRLKNSKLMLNSSPHDEFDF